MRTLSTATGGFALVFLCGLIQAEELTKEAIAVRDYCFAGVSIGTTTDEFRRLFPQARRQDTGESNIKAMYAALGPEKGFILVECFRGKVYYLGVVFTPETLFRIGGREVLEAKITDTLGFPDSVKGNMSYWSFPEIDRNVAYKQSADGSSMLLIIDTAARQEQRAARISELDIGF